MNTELDFIIGTKDPDSYIEDTVRTAVFKALITVAEMCENTHPSELPLVGAKIRNAAVNLTVEVE
jgi:hypothetical protein